jgi:hypothetical protein
MCLVALSSLFKEAASVGWWDDSQHRIAKDGDGSDLVLSNYPGMRLEEVWKTTQNLGSYIHVASTIFTGHFLLTSESLQLVQQGCVKTT